MAAQKESAHAGATELFVGREREQVELDSALADAIAGRGRLCLIAGEPGIGKTRLAESLAAKASERGANVIWGRCWEGEGAPAFWPWVQVIRACVRDLDAKSLEGCLGVGAPYVAQVVPEVRNVLADVEPAPPLDSEQARFKLYDACAAFLRSVAAKRPLVIVLDDLHWADKSSLLLLQFLAREVGDASILLVGTYRDVEVARGHPLADVLPRLRRQRTVDRMLLRGLGEDEVRSWVAELRGADAPETLARKISRETGGNPFYIKETLRHLDEHGADDVELPESVREVIGRRLDRLGEECTKLLTLASLVGQEFGLDVLQRVSEIDNDRIMERLESAAAARVIDEVPGTIGRYRFAHTLIRESLYGELRNLERIRLHRRVAEVLEKIHARDPEPHLAEIAHHFLESLPGGDAEKAVGYATRAGDRAYAQLSYEEAAIRYDRALQALDLVETADDKRRYVLLQKHGDAVWGAGAERIDSYDKAAELAERIGDPELLARAAINCAGPSVGFHIIDGDRQLQLLERALVALGAADSAIRAEVMSRVAAARVLLGDPRDGAKLAGAAIDMARRVGDKRALAAVLDTAPWAIWDPDGIEDRIPLADELIRIAEEVGDERLLVDGYVWKTSYYLHLGDVAAADREVEAQERVSARSRHSHQRWISAMNRGARAYVEGRFDDAEKAMEGIGDPTISRAEMTTSRFGIIRSFIHHQQGRSSEDLVPRMLTLATRHPKALMWRVAVAAYRIDLGQIDEARHDFAIAAANDFADIPRNIMWFNILTRLSDIATAFRDERRAAILYDMLLPYADRYVIASALPIGWGSVSRSLGNLAALLGRTDAAERHFEAAIELNTHVRAHIWVAHTKHELARMLVARNRAGDREKAERLAAEALAFARDVGMKLLEGKVLALRAAHGFAEENVPQTEARPGKALFRREGEFWTIAYEGKTLRLRDAKGLQYVAELIRAGGQEVHAADLAAGGDGRSADRGDAGEVLDAQARGEYKQRIDDLEAELDEATRWGDAGRTVRIREEIDFLKDELASALGLGGRARKAASNAERARKAVASRMQDTIAKIKKEHPVLALHLANSIRTGLFCCYVPERPEAWEID